MFEQIFEKHRNVLIILVAIFVILLGLYKFYSFYELRINELNQNIKEINEKTALVKDINTWQGKILKIKEKFIPQDSYSFIKLVNGYLQNAGLDIISIRPSDRFSYLSEEDEAVSKIVLSLRVKGSFTNLMNFLRMIDRGQLNITVLGLRIKEEKEEIQAEVEIVGLALKEK